MSDDVTDPAPPPEAPPRRPARWRVLRYLLFLVAVFGVGYVAASLWFAPPELFSGRLVVPRVLEEPADRATAMLEEGGLAAKLVESRQHPTAPPGTVIWQDPSPGTEALAGTTVRLWTSEGPAQVLVPDLKGLAAGQALRVLAAAGLVAGRTDSVANAPEPGVVVGTRPSAGTPRPAGSPVDILVGAEGR
ncbi:MAG: PASTA domain-containing protein [Gemmatimonadales bacterium]|nr:PASTA domain-containing protein [Gemmatimonadales bacterium]